MRSTPKQIRMIWGLEIFSNRFCLTIIVKILRLLFFTLRKNTYFRVGLSCLDSNISRKQLFMLIRIAHAVQSVEKSIWRNLHWAGWVGRQSKTYEKRLLNAKFETNRNPANYDHPALSVATVDVPGVITSIPWRPCKHVLYPLGCNVSVYWGLLMETYIIWRGLWRCLFSRIRHC